MEIEEETSVSTSQAESSAEVLNTQSLMGTTASQYTPIMPPPIVAPATIPPMAPIPTMPPPQVPAPLAPVPVRPSVFKPPQNGEVRASDSDSDHDDLTSRSTAGGYEISDESRQGSDKRTSMQDLMMKRRAAALAVPTCDMAVCACLHQLGEPITLFEQKEMERRDRLRMLMAKLDSEGQLEKLMKAHEDEEAAASAPAQDVEEETFQYPFYTEGPKSL